MFTIPRFGFFARLALVIVVISGLFNATVSAAKMREVGTFVVSDAEFNDLYSFRVLWDKEAGYAQNTMPVSYQKAASRFLAREYPALIEVRGLGKKRFKARFPGKINAYFFFVDKTTGFFKKNRVYENVNFNISWITPEKLLERGLNRVMGIFGSLKYIPAAASYANRQWYWSAAGFNEAQPDNLRAIGFVNVSNWQYYMIREGTLPFAQYVEPDQKFEVSQKLNHDEWLYSIK